MAKWKTDHRRKHEKSTLYFKMKYGKFFKHCRKFSNQKAIKTETDNVLKQTMLKNNNYCKDYDGLGGTYPE